jgi:hypothetical protein
MNTGKLLLFLLITLPFCFYGCERKNTYYIDPTNGSDANSGKRINSSWKTLGKAASHKYLAGDQLLLKGGQEFQGSLVFDSIAGSPEKPYVISSYGQGRAIILSGDSAAITFRNSSFVEFKNLTCKGSGRLNGNKTNGFDFISTTNLTIDSVEASGYLFSGIRINGGNNICITHAYAHDNGFCGIHVTSDRHGKDDSKDKSIRNVYIGYSVAENNPGCPVITDNHSGNGILIGGVTNGLIEYCEAMKNGWDMPRKGNGPVGIWAYQCDSVTIQHCYAHHNATSPQGHDGGGFDFDGGMTNSIMQYNLSAFNEGPGYGIFQYADAKEWFNNVVRYNISYHDGIKNGQCGILMWCDPVAIPMKDFNAYNNTIVNKFGYGVNFLPGHYENFVFNNNLFLLTEPSKEFTGGEFTGVSFNNNLYWNTYHALNEQPQPRVRLDPGSITADPQLVLPDSDTLEKLTPETINAIKSFRLTNSGLKAKGKNIDNNGGLDYWGNMVSKETNPSIGAFE